MCWREREGGREGEGEGGGIEEGEGRERERESHGHIVNSGVVSAVDSFDLTLSGSVKDWR